MAEVDHRPMVERKPTVRALDACRPTDLPGLRTDGYQLGMARRDETIISVRGEGSERMVDWVGPDSFKHGVAFAPVWLIHLKMLESSIMKPVRKCGSSLFESHVCRSTVFLGRSSDSVD